LESILKQVEQLSQVECDTLASAILPHALDTLDTNRIILERSKGVVFIIRTPENPLSNRSRLRRCD